MTDNEIIREKVGIGEIMAQLAEEAAELSQAALKYRRAITGTNPTPTTAEEALEHLREEIADVDLCLVIAGDVCEAADDEIFRMETKRARWIERLGVKRQSGPLQFAGAGIEDRNCNGACTGPGRICHKLRPDFSCEFDRTEGKT